MEELTCLLVIRNIKKETEAVRFQLDFNYCSVVKHTIVIFFNCGFLRGFFFIFDFSHIWIWKAYLDFIFVSLALFLVGVLCASLSVVWCLTLIWGKLSLLLYIFFPVSFLSFWYSHYVHIILMLLFNSSWIFCFSLHLYLFFLFTFQYWKFLLTYLQAQKLFP